jgi:vacuolar-type H+-ATPase subunit D/Vma8
MSIQDMYKVKKKRAVDPNAPPRPNLMTHEVKLRTAQQTIQQLEDQLRATTQRVEALERKLQNQTAYLQGVHDSVTNLRNSRRS